MPALAQPRVADDLAEVALRAAAGDRAAVADLVASTAPTVWRTCAALVDRDSADDLTQETFLRAVRSLPTYRGTSGPLPWLLAVARRVCADEIALRRRRRLTLTRLVELRARPASDATGLVELVAALAALPTDRREAFVLTAVSGLPYAEAAAICGCPVGTVRSRVARARADLARWLEADRAAAR